MATDAEERVALLEANIGFRKEEMREVRKDMRDLRTELKGDINSLKGDINSVLAKQKRDFRLLFGINITVALGLAGLMAKGFIGFNHR
jgi:hypothetical protein